MRNMWGKHHRTVLVQIVPHSTGTTDLHALEAMLQAMLLSSADIVSCEIVSDGQAVTLQIRCASELMAYQVQTQVLAHYPYSTVTRREDDPLTIQEGEQADGSEIRFTGASYLSLRTWKDWQTPREVQSGVDPLLGLMQSLTPLPAGVRAGVQLVLTPARDRWSQGHERHADRFTLAYSHHQETLEQRNTASGGFAGQVILLGTGAVLLWFFSHGAGATLARYWLHAVMTGKTPSIPVATVLSLLPLRQIGVLVVLVVLLAGALLWWQHRVASPVYDMRMVTEKTTQPGFAVRLRIVAIGPKEQEAETRAAITRAASSYRTYTSAGGLTWSVRRLPRWRVWQVLAHDRAGQRANALGWRRGVSRSPMLLSLTEAATLWHFPQPDDIPLLADVAYHGDGRSLPAPMAVRVPALSPWCLGVSRHAGHETPVGLSEDALQRHMLAIAKTGKGKSSLFFHLAQMTMNTPGYGLVLLDPHGDLVDLLVQSMPSSRIGQVVLIDLADIEYPIGFNPLDASLGRSRDKAVENLLAIFADVWESGWGYRMENAMGYALKTLYDANERIFKDGKAPEQFTLLDVEPLFQQEGFRRDVLTLVEDPVLLRWWTGYYDRLPPHFQTEIINPVLTKMAAFSGSRIARAILGQPQCTVDFRAIVAAGAYVLIKTARSTIGEATARLVGASLLGMVRVALEEQGTVANAQRRKFVCLVDEFQTLQGVDFGAMLAELRKFGATFILATQAMTYLDTLDPALRATVMSNIDTLFAFAMSADDARLIAPELDEFLTVRDLINLPDYSCYVKMTVQHRRVPVFSVELDPPVFLAGEPEILRERTRERYAPKTRTQILAQVEQVQQRFLPRKARPVRPPQTMPVEAPAAESKHVRRGRKKGSQTSLQPMIWAEEPREEDNR